MISFTNLSMSSCVTVINRNNILINRNEIWYFCCLFNVVVEYNARYSFVDGQY